MAVLKHQPTHDWIIGKKIHAPDAAEPTAIISGVVRFVDKPPHHYAVVLAIGPGREHPQTGYRPAPPCCIGDTIMVRKVAGDPENIEGEEYFWFMPDEVLGVIPKASLVG
jgi:co-chaperonin GroES (HSP10)